MFLEKERYIPSRCVLIHCKSYWQYRGQITVMIWIDNSIYNERIIVQDFLAHSVMGKRDNLRRHITTQQKSDDLEQELRLKVSYAAVFEE